MKTQRKTAWVIGVIVAALAVGGWTSRSASNAPAAPTGVADIVSKVSPSVVTIITNDGLGSGVVWSSDGTIVTADHVVTGSTNVKVQLASGTLVDGRVLAGDPVTDIAVVKANRSNLRAATFAKKLPNVGDLAIAMGSPLGFENTASAGIISGLHRSLGGDASEGPPLADLMQTDADISPGDSGGALVDSQGRVVGINEAYVPPSDGAVSIGFATPATRAVRIVRELLKSGTVSRPSAGGQLTDFIPPS